ncbi:hypothetical protein NKDENANG_03950 [Candidatus Entotheonellaceae bacterium PAL068K]
MRATARTPLAARAMLVALSQRPWPSRTAAAKTVDRLWQWSCGLG